MAAQSAASDASILPVPANSAGGSPAWVLLDQQAQVAYRRNGTTARAVSTHRYDIEVSFCFADPPRLSRFCIYSPPGANRAEFASGSRVVCSAGGFAVLRLEIANGGGVSNEYYLYRANLDRPPSLRFLTLPANGDWFYVNENNLYVLPRAGGGDDGFFLATLYLQPEPMADHRHKGDRLRLQIFSSESSDWSTKLVTIGPSVPQDEKPLNNFVINFVTNKVMSLGEGLLGWVDLSQGILFCYVFEENPILHYIQLPTKTSDTYSARTVRDATYCNGLIKFIEMETMEGLVGCERSSNVCHKDISPFDWALQLHTYNAAGWRAITWSRMISWKCWQKCCMVTHDDISVDNLRHADLLAELRGNYSREITLQNLLMGAPRLSISNSDVVYLMSKVTLDDKNAWIIAINLRNKTMEDLAPVSAEERFYFNVTYYPCTLSKYLNISRVFLQTPNRSALHGLTNTTLIVGKLHPSITKHRLEVLFSKYGKLKHVEIFENEQYARVQFTRSLCAEKAFCRLNGAVIGRRRILLSWEHHNQ